MKVGQKKDFRIDNPCWCLYTANFVAMKNMVSDVLFFYTAIKCHILGDKRQVEFSAFIDDIQEFV